MSNELQPGPGDSPGRVRANAALERLHKLYPKLIDLRLERLQRLLADLGNPERQLPPVVHVAGTNGKGSVCAFARAVAEAAGLRVHVFTSPHLVRFNERIRLAGELVSDEQLAEALDAICHQQGPAAGLDVHQLGGEIAIVGAGGDVQNGSDRARYFNFFR